MSFLEFVNCCFSEDIPREDINKLLLVYSDKTLTHYQKCVIDQKTISKTVCYTISKTQELLNGKFASSTKKKLSQNYVLLLICRESFLRFSTRMINFFEFPLTLRRLKPPGFEYFFFVMDQNELKGLDEEKKDSILQMSHLTSLLEKGRLYKKNRMGDFIEKYFILTKNVLLYLDRIHKKKKMHVMELGNIELEILKTNKEKEILEVKCPKKIYYLKAESKNVFNSWFNKLTIQVNMIKQNIYISEFETKIAKNESSLGLKLVSSILGSFNNIENIFTNSLLKQWFFQFIQEISPEEAGLLLLLEFYIKFKKELKAENYKEAFKNCNRIYEIIRKVSEDWERKCFPLDQEPEEIKVKSNSFKRNTRNSIIKSPTKINIDKKTICKMYHMKNNPPSAEKKSPTNHPIISLKNKNKQKNRFNVKIEFQELKLQKTKSKNLTNIIKEDQQIRKVETLEEELTFHEDFFLKIFKFFDWSHCERKFLYMKDVYLYDGIECQITDLFEKFFQNVVKYLESNYYHSFLESNFYKKKLLFFQRDKLEERLSFTKPSFFSKEKQKGSNRILSFDLENQLTSSMMFKKKRAVAALQLQDIRNMKYAKENPYSIFQESERSSILPYFPQNKKNFFFEKEEAILEETQIADN